MEGLLRVVAAVALLRWARRRDIEGRVADLAWAIAFSGAAESAREWNAFVAKRLEVDI